MSSQFIRLRTVSGPRVVVNVNQVYEFVANEAGGTTVNYINGSTREVQESERVIRGLIQGDAEPVSADKAA